MIIQATRYGTAEKEEPFAFTYSGDFTDERVDGKGTVTLNTSGQLIVTSGTATVQVYILGAGGGGAYNSRTDYGSASGGSGGYQTVEVELTPGTYDIVIGTGGTGVYKGASGSLTAGNGGNTVAFGYTSTGGSGGQAGYPGITASPYGGPGGSPNGNSGTTANPSATLSGGSPNGGNSTTNAAANKGGNGLVRITFS